MSMLRCWLGAIALVLVCRRVVAFLGSIFLFLVLSNLAQIGVARADGAFAFSQNQNGEWSLGSARNYLTEEEARSTALSNCRKYGGERCRVITTFKNRCAAVAIQRRDNGYGVAVRETQEDAEEGALSGCNEHGLNCSIKESLCDTRKVAQQSSPTGLPNIPERESGTSKEEIIRYISNIYTGGPCEHHSIMKTYANGGYYQIQDWLINDLEFVAESDSITFNYTITQLGSHGAAEPGADDHAYERASSHTISFNPANLSEYTYGTKPGYKAAHIVPVCKNNSKCIYFSGERAESIHIYFCSARDRDRILAALVNLKRFYKSSE